MGHAQAKPEGSQPPCTGECKKVPAQSRSGRALLDQRFAVINSNGTLARGNGVSSSTRLGTGIYQVIFTRNVTACTYNATVGQPGNGSTDGFAMTAARAGNVNGVFIDTRDALTGNRNDRSFHLLVSC
ncbi:MAG TPA: hypothetical protein V6D19_00565 [Stenomitos sp.]